MTHTVSYRILLTPHTYIHVGKTRRHGEDIKKHRVHYEPILHHNAGGAFRAPGGGRFQEYSIELAASFITPDK